MPERYDDLALTIHAPPAWHLREGREPRFVGLLPDAAVDIVRDARRRDDTHVVFAFTHRHDTPLVELVCETAAFELTIEVEST